MNVSKKKLIVIVGTTAVGKTKLSVEIAKRICNGPHEVISADSVQVYRSIPITSAMVTEEEADGIRHHFVDILESNQSFTAFQFAAEATPIVNKLQDENKIAIVAGGTFMWVEFLIYENFASSAELKQASTNTTIHNHEKIKPMAREKNKCTNKMGSNDDENKKDFENFVTTEELKNLSEEIEHLSGQIFLNKQTNFGEEKLINHYLENEKIKIAEDLIEIANVFDKIKIKKYDHLWDRLNEVDPVLAAGTHRNDTYRIRRGIDVFEETGIPLSEQKKNNSGDKTGRYGEPRFDALFLWLDCKHDVLMERINNRIDKMVKEGMLEEVWNFYVKVKKMGWKNYEESLEEFPETKTAGFTVFLPYFIEREKLGEATQKTIDECLNKLKIWTRRYAKKQKKWIQNRLLEVPAPIYRFDASNVKTWNEQVCEPAVEVVNCFFKGEELPPQSSYAHLMTLPPVKDKKKEKEKKKQRWEQTQYHCDICNRDFIGDEQWQEHLKSKKHRKKKKYLNLQKHLKEIGVKD